MLLRHFQPCGMVLVVLFSLFGFWELFFGSFFIFQHEFVGLFLCASTRELLGILTGIKYPICLVFYWDECTTWCFWCGFCQAFWLLRHFCLACWFLRCFWGYWGVSMEFTSWFGVIFFISIQPFCTNIAWCLVSSMFGVFWHMLSLLAAFPVWIWTVFRCGFGPWGMAVLLFLSRISLVFFLHTYTVWFSSVLFYELFSGVLHVSSILAGPF